MAQLLAAASRTADTRCRDNGSATTDPVRHYWIVALTGTPAFSVRHHADAGDVLHRAASLLPRDPVRHNVMWTLLTIRAAHPEPGRYWVVEASGDPVGVALQSPLTFDVALTPMTEAAVHAVAGAIAGVTTDLPGVIAEAATAAAFAGRWSELTKRPATPAQGQRIYEVDAVVPAAPIGGEVRVATVGDLPLLRPWTEGFSVDTDEGSHAAHALANTERRVRARQLWIWEDGGPRAFAGLSPPVGGVTRVGPVYTPGEHRRRGYASALTAAISAASLAEGNRCILYTDLANPTSNSVYRALGYHAVAEVLRYRFGDLGAPPGA